VFFRSRPCSFARSASFIFFAIVVLQQKLDAVKSLRDVADVEE
jgi:hypothetical protein